MPHDYFWQWHTCGSSPCSCPSSGSSSSACASTSSLAAAAPAKPWEPGRSPEGETALDILKKRYAKGEISKDEFEQMKRDISG